MQVLVMEEYALPEVFEESWRLNMGLVLMGWRRLSLVVDTPMFTKKKSKPILCIDFDGTVHSYTSGWKGARNIPDPPVDGAMDFLSVAVTLFDVRIFSSRSRYLGGRWAMKRWLLRHLNEYWGARQFPPDGYSILAKIRFPVRKPAAFLTIDDRAITFTGTFPEPEDLLKFKPWTKKGV
jgi:hypothetical protein